MPIQSYRERISGVDLTPLGIRRVNQIGNGRLATKWGFLGKILPFKVI